ncbi:lipoprotein [Bacterioplanes sanyensis]|uniref:alpha/beta hydrolase n=1 Tax=Bacterioplanes sanyensis TaxID=1249553 RepID=UPI0016734D45|nr:alpha/beta fold hydrolase [Bacterioplanes sanyensis]GGY54243.1 lipoprotein [Bacterioplanes sanyensis]
MKSVFLLCFCFAISGCSSLTGLFFYPQQVWIQTPANVGLAYEDIELHAADGTRLHAWWLPAEHAGEWVMLYLHGNAENISSHFRNVDWLPAEGVSVLALDYRGFGASQGQARLPDVFMDIEAALLWLHQHYPEKRLAILGQSIGAALTVPFVAQAQSQYRIDAVVLDAPLASYQQVARHGLSHSVVGWLLWPGTWLLPTRWDPIEHIHQLHLPVLMMHSPHDQVIPYEQGRKMYARLTVTGCWLESRGPHIASLYVPELREALLMFLRDQSCASKPAPE